MVTHIDPSEEKIKKNKKNPKVFFGDADNCFMRDGLLAISLKIIRIFYQFFPASEKKLSLVVPM